MNHHEHEWLEVDEQTAARVVELALAKRVQWPMGMHILYCGDCGVFSVRSFEDFDVWSARTRPVALVFD